MKRQEIVDVLERAGEIEAAPQRPGFSAALDKFDRVEVWYSDGWMGRPMPPGQLDRWAALIPAPYHVEYGTLPAGKPCLRITKGTP